MTPPRGTITLITGCMFSGKTTALLRLLDAYSPEACVTAKHVVDGRYATEFVVSHGGLSRPAAVIRSASELIGHTDGGTRIVGVDEAHFFDRELANAADALAGRGVQVVLTALNRDSWGEPFEIVQALGSLADEVVRKVAQCGGCGAAADRTQRLTPIIDGNMVGGAESYQPRCQACWFPPTESRPQHAAQF